MPYAQGRGLQSGQHGGPDSPGDIAQFRCDDRWIPLIRRAAAERRDQGIREQIKVLSGRAAENNPVGAENGQQCGQSRRNLSSVVFEGAGGLAVAAAGGSGTGRYGETRATRRRSGIGELFEGVRRGPSRCAAS
jgi:hypothetical protein